MSDVAKTLAPPPELLALAAQFAERAAALVGRPVHFAVAVAYADDARNVLVYRLANSTLNEARALFDLAGAMADNPGTEVRLGLQ